MSTESKPLREYWRADMELWKPVKTRGCDVLELDTDGKKIFSNSHFATEEEAWKRLKSEAEAWLHNSVGNLKEVEARVEAKRNEVIKASQIMVLLLNNRENWEMANAL